MYEIIPSRRFRRSYKKVRRSGQFERERLRAALEFLREGIPLPFSYQDHLLLGEYQEYRECHLKGDLLLIYEIRDHLKEVILVDIGSHSDLFG